MVSELIDPVYRTWRKDVIDNVFYDFEASIIKNIPLCHSIQDDILIWPFNLDREYSIKSSVDITEESPPSFCNGLGTMNIASFQGRTIDLTTRDMGSEFRYVLGKVLSTQNCPTLRLSSHHCVLCFNLIKNMFNTYIYTHTHTHTHTLAYI